MMMEVGGGGEWPDWEWRGGRSDTDDDYDGDGQGLLPDLALQRDGTDNQRHER